MPSELGEVKLFLDLDRITDHLLRSNQTHLEDIQ